MSGEGGPNWVPSVAPTSLENFLSTSRQLCASANFTDCAEFVAKSAEFLERNSTNLDTAVETLDMQHHALPIMGILTAHLSRGAAIAHWDDLFTRCVLFLREGNAEQLRYAPHLYADLCHAFAEELVRRGIPLQGLAPLLQVLPRLQKKPQSVAPAFSAPPGPKDAAGPAGALASPTAILTSVHSDICKLCLAAKSFGPALDLMEVDMVCLSKELTMGDPKYILLYYYYGGMILTAVKDFSRAIYYFEVCLTTPAVAVSHIMLEAFKKYLLVGLLQSGYRTKETQVLPKYTSAIVGKYLKPLSTHYQSVVAAYQANNKEELERVITRHADVFAADQNSGLVAQVQDSLTKTSVRRLTKTFVTLSLTELAARVGLNGPQEAERLIVDMIDEGSVNAKISQKDGMVRFDSVTERYNSMPMLDNLESNINRVMRLDAHIQTLEEEILVNPYYIRKNTNAPAKDVGGSGSMAAALRNDDDGAADPGVPPRLGGGAGAAAAGMNGGISSSSAQQTGNGVQPF